MSLYRYYKPVPKLPYPDGPLSRLVPSSSILDANDTYIKTSSAGRSSKRGSYVKLTGVQQAQIAKYALFHGNKEAIRQFTKQYCVEIRERHSKFINNLRFRERHYLVICNTNNLTIALF